MRTIVRSTQNGLEWLFASCLRGCHFVACGAMKAPLRECSTHFVPRVATRFFGFGTLFFVNL